MTCPTNLNLVFPAPSLGVGGILLNRKGEVLLIKRGQPPAEGLWSIPGGRLEPGETLAAACQREFLEETGLAVVVNKVVAVVERKLEGFHYVIIDFVVGLVDESNTLAIPQSDVLEAKWVKLVEFGQYQLVEGLAEIIYRAHDQHLTTSGLYASEVLAGDFILPTR